MCYKHKCDSHIFIMFVKTIISIRFLGFIDLYFSGLLHWHTYDCLSTKEEILKDMGKINQYPTTRNPKLHRQREYIPGYTAQSFSTDPWCFLNLLSTLQTVSGKGMPPFMCLLPSPFMHILMTSCPLLIICHRICISVSSKGLKPFLNEHW